MNLTINNKNLKKNILEIINLIGFLFFMYIIFFYLPFTKNDLLLATDNLLINIHYTLIIITCLFFFIIFLFIEGNSLIKENFVMSSIIILCFSIFYFIICYIPEYLNIDSISSLDMKTKLIIIVRLSLFFSMFIIYLLYVNKTAVTINFFITSKSIILSFLLIFMFIQNIYIVDYMITFTTISIIPSIIKSLINDIFNWFSGTKFYAWLKKNPRISAVILGFLIAIYWLMGTSTASGKAAGAAGAAAKKAAGTGFPRSSAQFAWTWKDALHAAANGTVGFATAKVGEVVIDAASKKIAELEGPQLIQATFKLATGEQVICEKTTINPVALSKGDIAISVRAERCYTLDASGSPAKVAARDALDRAIVKEPPKSAPGAAT